MELAQKVTPNIFKQVTGVNFKNFSAAITHHYRNNVKPDKQGYMYPKPDNMDDLWENEFTYGILDFIGNYEIPAGDLARLSSYGLVKRDGQDAIVIIDYGLTNDVYDNYYS
jgi:hypothetical protein